MKLIIDVDEKLVCEGFERPFTEEERASLIRAIGNGRSYNLSGDLISRESLRKAFHERIHHFNKSSWDEANALIDNALPVPQVTVFTESTNEKAIEDMKAELQSILDNERPKGDAE